MDLASFRDELRSRDGAAYVWLVYLDDAVTHLQGDPGSLLLQRACWTRGEAYAYAQRRHAERAWQHFVVYRVLADTDALEQDAWMAAFEMAFERQGVPEVVSVSPTAVAQALGRR
jgi:hypothetical protein